jgi:hypothetical protein
MESLLQLIAWLLVSVVISTQPGQVEVSKRLISSIDYFSLAGMQHLIYTYPQKELINIALSNMAESLNSVF